MSAGINSTLMLISANCSCDGFTGIQPNIFSKAMIAVAYSEQSQTNQTIRANGHKSSQRFQRGASVGVV